MTTTSPDMAQAGTDNVTTDLAFYFDPLCPWAWRTSKWIREVQHQQPLEVEWRIFSLAEANGLSGADVYTPLRMIVLAQREGGNAAVGRLYEVLGHALHEQTVDVQEPGVFQQAIRDALANAGLDPTMLERALDDPSTLEEVKREHQRAVEQYGAYGVPWLVAGGQSFGFNGPVIDAVPQGESATALWRHVSWLLSQPYFYELKRER